MSDAGSQPDPAALVRGWLEHSPFASHLGLRLESLGHGEAELALPYEDKLATMGYVVPGGAGREPRRGHHRGHREAVAKGLVTYRVFSNG